MKIAIIGYSGAGKSTLAEKLGKIYDIVPLFLDTISFYPDWVLVPKEISGKIASDYIESHDSWIVDGNWRSLIPERYKLSDKIIFLNFNRFRCLYYVIKRYKENKGKVRFSSAPGCVEKLDLSFLMWILFKGRTRKTKKKYKQIIEDYPKKVIIFKKHSEIDLFLKSLS